MSDLQTAFKIVSQVAARGLGLTMPEALIAADLVAKGIEILFRLDFKCDRLDAQGKIVPVRCRPGEWDDAEYGRRACEGCEPCPIFKQLIKDRLTKGV